MILERVMNSTEKPHQNADSSVSSVSCRSPVFRITKPLLSKFITASRVLLVDIKKKLSDGVYGVDWEVTSKDGHVIDGALGFTVERSSKRSEGATDSKAKQDEGASLGTTLAASLAILAVCVVGLAVFGVLRRR
jgi:hypothetical protein